MCYRLSFSRAAVAVADELDMVYRMAEYYVMLERKYRLPVRQFVIFLGSSAPQMPVRLDRVNLTFDFPLISFSSLDYRLFLRSAQPEEVLLSILANFGGDTADVVLSQIVQRVEETSRGDFSFKKHVNQLRVLAQLRNLGIKLKSAMDSIAQFISPEKDAFYLIGQERAEERIVRGLLTKSVLSVEQIADAAEVSVEFVKEVKQKLIDSQ